MNLTYIRNDKAPVACLQAEAAQLRSALAAKEAQIDLVQNGISASQYAEAISNASEATAAELSCLPAVQEAEAAALSAAEAAVLAEREANAAALAAEDAQASAAFKAEAAEAERLGVVCACAVEHAGVLLLAAQAVERSAAATLASFIHHTLLNASAAAETGTDSAAEMPRPELLQ